jgi:dienelactone hydrolase
MIRLIRSAFATLCIVATSWASAAQGDLGIVLLHGKWDRAPTNVLALSRQLEDAGYKVAAPLMPWSDARGYDATYTQALEEIEAAAKSLRSKGATKIVIAGLSFGANGAIAYAASGRQVDGIAALSPGHTPERGTFRKTLEPSVAKARGMVDSGRGTDKAWFDDLNQGQRKSYPSERSSVHLVL